MRNATLKDVAAQAGVSTATVSRVLHNNGYVSAAARERVEAALRESDYRLNTVAQELRRQRAIALGLILHGVGNPVHAEIAMGVEEAAAEQGFHVLLFNARGSTELERHHVETLLRRRVDGIILGSPLERRNVRLAIDAGVSVVQMIHRSDPGAAAVLVEGRQGALDAMRHLLALGHRKIGYLGEPIGYVAESPGSDDTGDAVKDRFDAYCEALEEAGISVDPAHLVAGEFPREEGGWGGLPTGADHMRRLLEQAPDLTAVFAVSDIIAAGALQELYRQGVRVPQDISIVGFDDSFAPHLSPSLTSVRQPMFQMGLLAASVTIEQLSDLGGPPSTVTLTSELIVRESTAPPSAR